MNSRESRENFKPGIEKKGNGIEVVLKKDKIAKNKDKTVSSLDSLSSDVKSQKRAQEYLRDPDTEDVKTRTKLSSSDNESDKKLEVSKKNKKETLWSKLDSIWTKVSGVINHPKGFLAGVWELLTGKKRGSNENLEEDNSLERNMSDDQIEDLISKNPNLSFLKGNDYMRLEHIKEQAKKMSPKERELLGYDFNALSEHRDYPDGREGRRCCALYVSKVLGLSKSYRQVRHILSLLVSKNMEKTGKSGMVFGYKNMKKGDVVFFRGNKKYAEGRYGHIAVVRHDPFYVNGVKCIAISHDGADIQCNIIPVDDADNNKIKQIQEVVNDPSKRKDVPELREIFKYRKKYPETVKVSYNRRWYGDASQNGGTIAFAVRTRGIMKSNMDAKLYS